MLQLTDYRCPANQLMCSQAVGNFCKERAFIRDMNTMDAVLLYKDVSFKWSSKVLLIIPITRPYRTGTYP